MTDLIQLLAPSPRRRFLEIARAIGVKTALDFGCGDSSPLASLRKTGTRTTGIDIDPETVDRASKSRIHDEYIVGNLSEVVGKQFDAVYCSHVIEHLSREEGLQLLVILERIARRLIYIETPNGFLPQRARDGNIYQRHLSGWLPNDFIVRGYSVYGVGLSILRGEEGRSRLLPEEITRIVERTSRWLPYFAPNLGHSIGAIQFRDEEGNIRHPNKKCERY